MKSAMPNPNDHRKNLKRMKNVHNSLDDIMRNHTRMKIRKSLNSELMTKFNKETLKAHLTSTVSAAAAAAVSERLPPGVTITGKQLLELARTHGGFKRIIPTEGDFETYEASPVVAEDNKVGIGMGSTYKKCLVLTKGAKQDSQMKLAKTLYKSQNWPCFDSQSSKYYGSLEVWKQIQSTAGTNRQGVWFPFNITAATGPITSNTQINRQSYINPVLQLLQAYEEIRTYLIDSEVLTWLNQEENNSSDLFYAINSFTDVITFSNAGLYLPLNLKIYVCKCKQRTKFAPAADWFIPTGEEVQSYNRMTSNYVYDSGNPVVRTPSGGGTGSNIFDETSVHVGSTPFYSPTFRENWEVTDVVRQTIETTDKFELTLHREFRNCHSIRQLEEGRDSMQSGFYLPGDYGLIITYKGSPCIMKYQGGGPDYDLKEVDCSPVKLMMSSRSSMNITAPDLYTTSNTSSTSSRTTGNYITGEGRVLDVSLDTHPYNDVNWLPNVITNVEEKSGGSR